jgi:DNA-directed RNA polymerase beta' subunit
MVFSGPDEVLMAHDHGIVEYHSRIKLQMQAGIIIDDGSKATRTLREATLVETTPGRVYFNQIIPRPMPFYNKIMNKKLLGGVIADCLRVSRPSGRPSTCSMTSRISASAIQHRLGSVDRPSAICASRLPRPR